MKIAYTLLLSLLPLLSFGQSFVLTPEGLRDSADETKDYLVIPIEGKTAAELYQASKNYIQQLSKNPKESIKGDSPNEYLRFAIYIPEVTSIGQMGGMVKMVYEGLFDVEMRFKDGRIRYNISNLEMPMKDDEVGHELKLSGSNWGGWAVFDTKGKVKLKKQKTEIEDFFNGLVYDYTTTITSENVGVSDDW